jgi:hypothetical protein
MNRLTKLALGAAAVVAFSGGAFAQQMPYPPQPAYTTAPQTSYVPMEPKPSGSSYIAPDHFEKPAGYDQNPWNYPYGPHTGPRPN